MESSSTALYDLARAFGPQLISLATLLVCLVIALVRWKRHPKISLLVSLALFFLLAETLIFNFVEVFAARRLQLSSGLESDRFYLIFGLVVSATMAIAYAVLLVAIFAERKTASSIGINVSSLKPR